MENGQCNHSDPRVVVGLDFGTTYSGFAFATTSDITYTKFFDPPKAGGEKPYCKTLTAIYYKTQADLNDNWAFKSWGYSSRAEYERDMRAARRRFALNVDAGPHLARGSTTYIGVRYLEELNKYVSEIRPTRSSMKIWLGTYDTAEEAARAFDIGNLCCKKNLPLNFPDSPSMLKKIPSGLSPEDARRAIAKLAKDVAHQYHGKADGELQSPFQNHDPRRQDYGTNPVLQESRPLTGDGDSGYQAMNDKCEDSKKLQSQLMARDPEPNIKYSINIILQISRAMLYMQERELVHRDLKASNILVSNVLVANPVDCVELSAIGTVIYAAPEILNYLVLRKLLPRATRPRYTDVYSFAMACYEILTAKSPFLTKELPYTRKSSGRTRPDLPTTEDIGALLKTCLLAPKQDAGPDWGNVSELLLGEYGIDRASTSCKILWGSLQRCYNAIRNHEMMIYNGTTNGPSYFEMDEEERSKNMLPPVFDLEWCQMMETILKAKSVEVQSGTTADECTGLSNCEEVLCADDEEDESCESAVSEVEDSTADSYVPQTEPTTDNERIDAYATLRNLVEDMVRPLITALRTRVEEEQKHRQKVLTAEMDKVALMLQDIRRALAYSNEPRGKDLPELPSQQISVASGGKRKADMEVDRQAKKQAGNAGRCDLLLHDTKS